MTDFLKAFKNYIHKAGLYVPSDRLLLAVSGGIDSMVLADLCHQAGYTFAIAHCNFKLRGDASDGDESSVKQWAEKHSVPFFTVSFDTVQLADERKQSIQLAARELRYEWLEEIRQKEGYDWILTAHHLNDSIETILYNFTKGCGLKGLHGIPEKNGFIVRPLLFATRVEIEAFAKMQGIAWREDASNETDKYARNFIRHQIVPLLISINPAFESGAAQTIQRIQEAEHLYHWAISNIMAPLTEEVDTGLCISFEPLLKNPARSTILYEYLLPYGFNADQIQQLFQTLEAFPDHQPGAQFAAAKYQLLVDRRVLLLEPIELRQQTIYILSSFDKQLELPDGKILIEKAEGKPALFYQDNYTVCLDLTETDFPLTVRHWQAGDFFHPLGMKGKTQKLQDFFTHQKLNRLEKDRVWIVETAEKAIAWVVGHRIDHHFRIDADTDGYFVLSFKKM